MSQKVLVVLLEVPEEVHTYILPEDAPELPKLREIAAAGVHGNGYYKDDPEKKGLSWDLAKLFYSGMVDEDGSKTEAPMKKYHSNGSKTSVFTTQTSGDFSEVITLACYLF